MGAFGAAHCGEPREVDLIARVLAARVLHDARAAHRVPYVNGEDQPRDQALEAVLSGQAGR